MHAEWHHSHLTKFLADPDFTPLVELGQFRPSCELTKFTNRLDFGTISNLVRPSAPPARSKALSHLTKFLEHQDFVPFAELGQFLPGYELTKFP